ncbi:MAG TPA: OmpA family protein [Gemmatimonadales bacterium]|nr:OmpA family protein [Gemmatimonadales bacterium]
MLALSLLTSNLAIAQHPQPPVAPPIQPGATIVNVVSGDTYQASDYETVIVIESVADSHVTLGAAAFVKIREGVRRWLSVKRTVQSADLGAARTQILGFHPNDPERLPGTTAMGPSRLVLDELRRNGRTAVVVRDYATEPENTGVLERVGHGTVAFPLLVNGLRVSVSAVRARGQLRNPTGRRPWEFWFLDDPLQPLTLKVMYGARGETELRRPEWSRQVVRIDSPIDVVTAEGGEIQLQGHGRALARTGGVEASGGGALQPGEMPRMGGDGRPLEGAGVAPSRKGAGATGESAGLDGSGAAGGVPNPAGGRAMAGDDGQTRMSAGGGGPALGAGGRLGSGAGAGAAMERRLATQCRVPVPGIYFEFDSDVLNPASGPWIRSIAELLRRHPDWAITIEGHTDSVGSARYNLDLSARRAAALARSLTSQHGIVAARLGTRGFGPDRPLESNATPEGRARNRRVELVRPCDRPADDAPGLPTPSQNDALEAGSTGVASAFTRCHSRDRMGRRSSKEETHMSRVSRRSIGQVLLLCLACGTSVSAQYPASKRKTSAPGKLRADATPAP